MTAPAHDIHVHSSYSDGSDLAAMVQAAADAGLDGVGVADHCIVVDDDFGRRARYDLVETYEERRADIEAVRAETPIDVFDAAEVSYVPDAEAEIAAFLDRADFEYTVGSVHFAGPYDYTGGAQYAHADEAARRAAVETYFETVVDLVESELFDVAGHLDLVQRIPPLRGFAERRHYEALAGAFADSRTVPEINAGHLTRAYGEIHPEPRYLAFLRERGVEFALGTDAHRPHEVRERIAALEERGITADVTPV
ncbi:MAG: histidinol-phosphatase HisJ family protein [Halobacteriaceae archaeon]